jgi:hypothetical protein
MGNNYVIVRTYSAGCFFGKLRKRDGREVTLDECRRLWYWSGAASLSQLASSGTSDPGNCKFPAATNNHLLLEAIEVIPCTETAVASIQGVPVWSK